MAMKKIHSAILTGCVSCAIMLVVWLNIVYGSSEYLYKRFGTKENDYDGIKIPDEIIKSKDCKKFKKWALKSKDGAAFFSANKCPWAKALRDIVHYKVHGVDFNIPRQYLSIIMGNEEGETESVYLDVVYPGMSPRKSCKFSKNNITITITSSKQRCDFWYDKPLCDVAQAQYKTLTSLFSAPQYQNAGGSHQYYYKLLEKDSKYGTDIYRWFEMYPDHSHHPNSHNDYYIVGDPLSPSYYMFCSPKAEKESGLGQLSVFCESYLNFPDSKVLVRYVFSKQFLPKHFEVRQAVIDKLNEFVTIEE